ncbi:MAG TPA: cytochrome c [Kofleriaceae bacterium]|nr:cytochrome c [Kofleriaceae bacterium]
MTRAGSRRGLGLGLALAWSAWLAACDRGEATPDWSRMITQGKLLPFGEAAMFPDGRAMRPLPAGVVARDRVSDPARRTGLGAGGAELPAVPLPITRALLERGRERFAIACAACHGLAGDGDTPVARAMQRRRPPSLHEPRIRALSSGAMYRVIALGYGVMPSYAGLLAPDDRWAVVAYVRTLELAWTARLDALPPSVRDEVARRLR